jgi:ankyrin repeat protein
VTTNPLFHAINQGDLARVRILLAQEPEWALARVQHGWSVLIYARSRGRYDLIEALLEARGDTLDVFEAAALGKVDRLARLIAEQPLGVHQRGPDGYTPLQLAALMGEVGSARLLLQRGAEAELVSQNPMQLRALHAAVSGGSAEIVTTILRRGCDANARRSGGWTALHMACANGRVDMVRALLHHGADPLIRNDDGKTAYDLAVAKNHALVVQVLGAVIGVNETRAAQ